MKLDDIAKKYGTDKSTDFHGYTLIYEKLITDLWGKSLLEIGVLDGASIKMWHEYLPRWQITGVDINQDCKKHETEDIKIIIEDQTKLELLKKYDVIIDDGSHNPKHFIQTLKNLWGNIKPGGLYIIEDLSVCQSAKHPVAWNARYSLFVNGEIRAFSTGYKCFLKGLESIEMHKKLIVFRKEQEDDLRDSDCTQ